MSLSLFAGAWRLDKTHTMGDERDFLESIGRTWFECKWGQECQERQIISIAPHSSLFTLHSTLELHVLLCPSIDFTYETKLKTNGQMEIQAPDKKGFGQCTSVTTVEVNEQRILLISKWDFKRKSDDKRVHLQSKRIIVLAHPTFYVLELEASLTDDPSAGKKWIRKRYVRALL